MIRRGMLPPNAAFEQYFGLPEPEISMGTGDTIPEHDLEPLPPPASDDADSDWAPPADSSPASEDAVGPAAPAPEDASDHADSTSTVLATQEEVDEMRMNFALAEADRQHRRLLHFMERGTDEYGEEYYSYAEMSAYLDYLAGSGNVPRDIEFTEEPGNGVPDEEYYRNLHYSSNDALDAERDLSAPEITNISLPAMRPTTPRSEAAGAAIAPTTIGRIADRAGVWGDLTDAEIFMTDTGKGSSSSSGPGTGKGNWQGQPHPDDDAEARGDQLPPPGGPRRGPFEPFSTRHRQSQQSRSHHRQYQKRHKSYQRYGHYTTGRHSRSQRAAQDIPKMRMPGPLEPRG